jgi:hypothetical protein
MKGKLLFAATLLSLSGAASCATLTDGVGAQFFSQNNTLVLKIKNDRKDSSVHIGKVSILVEKGKKGTEVAYQTTANVDVDPGEDATVTLLPVQQLATVMQKNGKAPTSGYSEIFVDNVPGACSTCTQGASYSFKSVGFVAQAEGSLNGTPFKVSSMFGGYLVFLAK